MIWAFPKIRGTLLGVLIIRIIDDYNILGVYIGSPCLGNLPFMRRRRKPVTVLYENLVHAPNVCALFHRLHLRTVALHAGIEGTLRQRIIFSWSGLGKPYGYSLKRRISLPNSGNQISNSQ